VPGELELLAKIPEFFAVGGEQAGGEFGLALRGFLFCFLFGAQAFLVAALRLEFVRGDLDKFAFLVGTTSSERLQLGLVDADGGHGVVEGGLIGVVVEHKFFAELECAHDEIATEAFPVCGSLGGFTGDLDEVCGGGVSAFEELGEARGGVVHRVSLKALLGAADVDPSSFMHHCPDQALPGLLLRTDSGTLGLHRRPST